MTARELVPTWTLGDPAVVAGLKPDLGLEDLHICVTPEEAGARLRALALAPAQPKPVPGYAYARDQFHLLATWHRQPVATATFLLEDLRVDSGYSADGRQWRLRAMGTDPQLQKLGFGRSILDHGLRILRGRGAGLLWCNGRTTAATFYQRVGFRQIGGERKREGVLPHYLFVRALSPDFSDGPWP